VRIVAYLPALAWSAGFWLYCCNANPTIPMLRNILLVTYRNLTKNRFYTSINIVGLALGIAAFIFIGAYVHFEKSYDRAHSDANNIYRVESRFYKGDHLTDDWATSTNGYAKAMKENIPGITSFTRINWFKSERVIRYNDIKYREEHVCFADSNFFSFFSYPLLKGDASTVLQEVNTMVISESAARKYFGNADPIGKVLDVTTQSESYHCLVTGVFKDIPPNSTLQFNFLMSWATSPEWIKEYWYMHESYTYVKLQPGTNIPALEAKFPAIAEQYKSGPALKDLTWAIHLVKLPDIHLNAAKQYEIETKGNRNAVNMLQIIAYIILIIACVNYINLATTKSVDRAREVGIRKVSGAHAMQLASQFLLESFIINLCALILAVILVIGIASWLPAFLNNNGIHGLLFDTSLFVTLHPCIYSQYTTIGYISGNGVGKTKTHCSIKRTILLFKKRSTVTKRNGSIPVYDIFITHSWYHSCLQAD
jgi:putative ABC transport system permease protein